MPIDQYVVPGNIIVRQRGTLFHPGQHVRPAYCKHEHRHSNLFTRLKWVAITQYTRQFLVSFVFTKKNGCAASEDLSELSLSEAKYYHATRFPGVEAGSVVLSKRRLLTTLNKLRHNLSLICVRASGPVYPLYLRCILVQVSNRIFIRIGHYCFSGPSVPSQNLYLLIWLYSRIHPVAADEANYSSQQ